MKSRNKVLITSCFGLAILLLTIVFFLVFSNKSINLCISYIFSLIGVTGIFLASIFLNDEKFKNFTQNVSFLTVTIIYTVIELTFSIIYIVFENISKFSMRPSLYFAIHLIILIITAIIIFNLIVTQTEITSTTNNTSMKIVNKNIMCNKVLEIKENAKVLSEDIRNNIIDELESVYDALKYSDPMSCKNTQQYEKIIEDRISMLSIEINNLIIYKGNDIEKVMNLMRELKNNINERNNYIKIMK